ncbi:MAG: M20/M25/M40 family metallo-hydrolase [Chloroflexi bacterium]|nr:MAG: M20/M25/M40 family metallo-hydrolase [Chloroflexota bacterium]TMF36154.1 MAG: M20/M25/M40 family metallo-hydrolase [Chloroflexota bacterium]
MRSGLGSGPLSSQSSSCAKHELNLERLEKLICELVEIESVNPDLVPGGAGEGPIAAFVASWLRDSGLEVTVVEPAARRPSVVGVLPGSGGGRSLMLNAHMDTVGAGGMPGAFSPLLRDGRVYGRGAYDMKASLAAIMLAAREARSLKLKGDLIVTAVADEEVASLGTAAVVSQFRADAAIVTEPTELRLCLAHKGFVWLEVETVGVAAHGSRADLGVDAIAHMGRVLTGVLELEQRLRSGPRHPLLGTGSIHASVIEGGQELSTYPARCVAKLERRTVPGEDGASCVREIEELIGDAPATVNMTLERQSSELAPDHALARVVSEAAGKPEQIGVAYWMDMALTNAAGIPTVAYGPAGEGAHADVEWVDLASVEKCVQVYVRAAELLCS